MENEIHTLKDSLNNEDIQKYVSKLNQAQDHVMDAEIISILKSIDISLKNIAISLHYITENKDGK